MKKNIYHLIFLTALSFCLQGIATAATHIITAADFQFSPDTMTVASGDTITWQWESGIHTTTANGIPDGAQQWNALLDSAHTSFSYVVNKAGTYHYISIPDLPSMAGQFTLPGPAGISPVLQLPFSFELRGNLVHDKVVISCMSQINAGAVVSLYDQSGKRVQVFSGLLVSTGKHEFALDFNGVLPASMYYLVMEMENAALARKLVIQ
ncbi:MAG: hypothetical protein K1X61_03130 [Chitinophagales bacterium]|nr:hypothetical protein [Chitinophagales bacterium]